MSHGSVLKGYVVAKAKSYPCSSESEKKLGRSLKFGDTADFRRSVSKQIIVVHGSLYEVALTTSD